MVLFTITLATIQAFITFCSFHLASEIDLHCFLTNFLVLWATILHLSHLNDCLDYYFHQLWSYSCLDLLKLQPHLEPRLFHLFWRLTFDYHVIHQRKYFHIHQWLQLNAMIFFWEEILFEIQFLILRKTPPLSFRPVILSLFTNEF